MGTNGKDSLYMTKTPTKSDIYRDDASSRPPGKQLTSAYHRPAARHPHQDQWLRNLQAALRPRKPREKFNWAAVT
jgi:hypothetical protein